MMNSFYIDAEDMLLAKMGVRLLCKFKHIVSGEKIHGGVKNIKKNTTRFNASASAGTRRLVLFDFDALPNEHHCPANEIKKLLDGNMLSPNLVMRIACAEAESWLLADWENLRSFLKIRQRKITHADDIPDAKQYLLNLVAAKAPPSVKRELLPNQQGTAKIGPQYNLQLTVFIEQFWDIDNAANQSDSLRRTIRRLQAFS